MEEQFTRRWMITLRVLEVDDHEQDNQKPLQDLFYRREKSRYKLELWAYFVLRKSVDLSLVI